MSGLILKKHKMKISVEKTVKQKLSKTVVDNASKVSVVHLPHNTLQDVLNSAIDINQQAGANKAIPHVAARSISSNTELDTFISTAQQNDIDTVLIIGGNPPVGPVFQNAIQVNNLFENTGIKTLCGVYPERDTTSIHAFKKTLFDGGITQLCLNPYKLKQYDTWTTPAIPTQCDAKGLWKYMKLCGLRDSFGYMLQNWRGAFYLTQTGFDTVKFIRDVGIRDYHLFNFGKLEQTLDSILTEYS